MRVNSLFPFSPHSHERVELLHHIQIHEIAEDEPRWHVFSHWVTQINILNAENHIHGNLILAWLDELVPALMYTPRRINSEAPDWS